MRPIADGLAKERARGTHDKLPAWWSRAGGDCRA